MNDVVQPVYPRALAQIKTGAPNSQPNPHPEEPSPKIRKSRKKSPPGLFNGLRLLIRFNPQPHLRSSIVEKNRRVYNAQETTSPLRAQSALEDKTPSWTSCCWHYTCLHQKQSTCTELYQGGLLGPGLLGSYSRAMPCKELFIQNCMQPRHSVQPAPISPFVL